MLVKDVTALLETKMTTKLCLAVVMTFLLSACGSGGGSDSKDDESKTQSTSSVKEQTKSGPIQISSQPQGIDITVGDTAIFSVTATGGDDLNFQWRKNQQNIQGGTSRILTLSNTSTDDEGLYDVVVSNKKGEEVSLSALLTVAEANTSKPTPSTISIISQPQSITANERSSASFSVQSVGNGNIVYQWLKNGKVISGENASTLTFASLELNDQGIYSVRVANSLDMKVSSLASLTVVGLPQPVSIVSQPKALSIEENDSASFSVQVSGEGSITYQWLKNGRAITGENASRLSFSSVSLSDQGVYSVRVANSQNTVVSSAVNLSVKDAPQEIVILSQPRSLSVDENDSASFDVQASGEGSITYQWLKNGRVITGENSSRLSFSSVKLSDQGVYSVRIANAQNMLASKTVNLNVAELIQAVSIVSQPEALSVDENTLANFNVQVEGSGDISYQWMKDGQAIDGANEAILSFPAVTLDDQGSYSVSVTNTQNTVTSVAVNLDVIELLQEIEITAQPQAVSIDENATASFTVEVSGDGEGVTYQWLKEGAIIDGATRSDFEILAATIADIAQYSVVITSENGVIISETASLDVTPVALISSIELTWDIPQEREDGSDLALGEINGYVIAYGSDEADMSNHMTVNGASVTSTVLEDLASGTYYFSIATVDSDGVQGAYSGVIQQSI